MFNVGKVFQGSFLHEMGEFYVVYDNEVKIYSKKLMEASDSFKLNGLKYNGLTIAPTRNLKLVGVFRLTVSSEV